ncbi:hypothetical protein H0H93_004846 [Arthromyces matolae]|nr:hypothetical protein H0H93_004846 [Arthromyces matolae]
MSATQLFDITGSDVSQLCLEKFEALSVTEGIEIEEGEILEETTPLNEVIVEDQKWEEEQSRSVRKTTSRHKRRRLRKEGDLRKREFEIEDRMVKESVKKETIGYAEKLIGALMGLDVYIYEQNRNSEYLEGIFAIEDERTEPLRADDPNFEQLKTIWIEERGLHLVFDVETRALVLAVRVDSFDDMAPAVFSEVTENLQLLMDYSTAVGQIKTNATVPQSDRIHKAVSLPNPRKAQCSLDDKGGVLLANQDGSENVSQGSSADHNIIGSPKPHGIEHGVPKKKRERFGNMYAAGWHPSMEKGKVIVAYAPKPDIISIDTYERCIKQFPKVAQLYRDRLLTMFPAGGQLVDEFAVNHNVPSFAAMTLDGGESERPFANSLTITRDDFSNYQHKDFDKIQIAFGLWWTAKKEIVDGKQRFSLHRDFDHDKVKNGQFLCASYGIGVNFEKCKGLVQIYWRGKFDFHGTMMSQSPADATRFGTSVQLTEKGTQAVSRFWEKGAADILAVTPKQRIDTARSRSKQKSKRRTLHLFSVMPSRLPPFFEIPELTRLVFENISNGRSLVAAAITCRYFATLALPVLWENEKIDLETLHDLVPEPGRLGELCPFFPPLDPAICSLFSQLRQLRVLQLGSSAHFPQIDHVDFWSDVLQSLILNYQDRELVKVLNGFRLPRVRRIQFCQFQPWFQTPEVLQKLSICCPSLEDISIESSVLSWFSSDNVPDFNPFDVSSALANFDLVRLKFEMQARIILPRSLSAWRTITDRMTGLHTLILNASDRALCDKATSVDLDVIILLVSSLPALKILLMPIIVMNEPDLRVSKENYTHPLRTLGTVFGNPPLAWTQSIVVCLKSIQEFAPEVLEIKDGEARSPSDTWNIVRRLFF